MTLSAARGETEKAFYKYEITDCFFCLVISRSVELPLLLPVGGRY